MALNKNHEFEELNGVKCGIVEKNATPERITFLKELLEYNGFEVITAPTPPPKVVAPKPAEENTEAVSTSAEATVDKPETFTIGVTDYTFNSTNAIFGRLLKTKNGQIVTLAYWEQQEAISNDEVPYFENKETWR
jgi:hypothetical protein